MLKPILTSALRRLVWLIGGNLLGILGMFVPLYLVRGQGGSLTAERLAIGIPMALVSIAALTVLSARHAYEARAAMPLTQELAASALALAAQILLANLFDFAIYIAGGAADLAAACYARADELLVLGDYRPAETMLAMLLLGALYIGAMLTGSRLGEKRRASERAQILSPQ